MHRPLMEEACKAQRDTDIGGPGHLGWLAQQA